MATSDSAQARGAAGAGCVVCPGSCASGRAGAEPHAGWDAQARRARSLTASTGARRPSATSLRRDSSSIRIGSGGQVASTLAMRPAPPACALFTGVLLMRHACTASHPVISRPGVCAWGALQHRLTAAEQASLGRRQTARACARRARAAMGMFFNARTQRGRFRQIINNWPSHNVQIIVVTDGGRILGLGDLGKPDPTCLPRLCADCAQWCGKGDAFVLPGTTFCATGCAPVSLCLWDARALSNPDKRLRPGERLADCSSWFGLDRLACCLLE